MDLYDFYRTGDGKVTLEDRMLGVLRPIDIQVSEGLRQELGNMATKVGLICLDIKPGNSMIKILPDGRISIKLIDWDGGEYGCNRGFANMNEKTEMVEIVNVIIMANHYLKNFNWNIFYNYFRDARVVNYIRENLAKMTIIFCKEITYAQFMATHYLFPDAGETDCGYMFNTMVKNAKKLEGATWDLTGYIGGNKKRNTRRKSKKRKKRRKRKKSKKR